jgi:hypothetical protein
MTRTHAAVQLLRHGPLSMREFIAITGWTRRQSRQTLNHLIHDHGILEIVKRGVYGLADWSEEHA